MSDHVEEEKWETDVSLAAADLYEKLQTGTYYDNGKRKHINGDFTKLMFAEHVSPLQKQLLADFRFRTSLLPGTQELRVQIGKVGFWATVAYGHPIFLTISPSERHSYLALRLSRYRSEDPHVDALRRPWIARSRPLL